MKICMLVYNSVTRDSRVMREASTLQAAGHEVTVVGVPDSQADAPFETAEEGVAIHRVHWQEDAVARVSRSAPLRIVPSIILFGLVLWGLVALSWTGRAVLAGLLLVGLLYIRWRVHQTRVPCEAVLKRWAEALFAGTARHGDFPPPRSLFPAWIPEVLLELALEPVDQLR